MTFSYTSEDFLFARDTLLAFLKKEAEPLFSRPEETVSPETLEKQIGQISDLGFLSGKETTGLGLWEEPANPDNLRFTVEALALLGEVNGGLAWAVHQLALGARALREFNADTAEHSVVALPHGTAKGILAKVVLGKMPDEEEKELLRDQFFCGNNSSRPVIFQAPASWRYLIAPVLSEEGGCLNWQLFRKDELAYEQTESNHGLDEIPFYETALSVAPAKELLPEQQNPGADFFIRFSIMNQLALTAVAAGAVRKSLRLARRYASERKQGGSPIEKHSAVRLMIGNAEAVTRAVFRMLETARPSLNAEGLAEVFSLRATAHPLLYRAATELLQVHGGYGYMRDFGLEKILRDVNHLMRMHGTPDDLKLFLAVYGEEK